MSLFIFANLATTTLASSLSPTATTVNLATGTGALFPNPGPGQIFALTLNDALTGLINEICYCTARSGDVLTVIRAQEGTSALSWNVGDTASNYWTAGQAAALVQAPYVQQQPGNFAVATGSANALTAALSPAILSLTQIIGSPIRIFTGASPNTGPVTLNLNGTGVQSVVATGGVAIGAGQFPAHSIFTVVWDGIAFEVQSNLAASGSFPPTGAAGGVLSGTYPNPGFQVAPNGTVWGNNSGSSGPPTWIPFLLPSGLMLPWPGTTAPSIALLARGQAVSRSTYGNLNALAAAAGYAAPWGPGDGSTTFNIPNTQGQFIRGWDAAGTVDPSRAFGSVQADAFQGHIFYDGVGVTTGSPLPFIYGGTAVDVPGLSGSTAHTDANTAARQGLTSTPKSDGTNGTPRTAAETRPTNLALNWIIII